MADQNGLTPYLTVRGAKAAVEFYKKAFGAEEITRNEAEDGERLMHCHLRVNGSDLMLSDDFSEGAAERAFKPEGVTLHLTVADADTWWNRALEAGATVQLPLENQFWGDRYGQLKDPFGHSWAINQPGKR